MKIEYTSEPKKVCDMIVTVSLIDNTGQGYLSEVAGIDGKIEHPKLLMGYILKAIDGAIASYKEIAKDIKCLDDYLS